MTTTMTRRTALFSFAALVGAGLTACGTQAATDTTSTASTGTTVADAAASATTAAATNSTTAETIAATASAAQAFLATLSDDQVDTLSYDYDDDTKTISWSNFPVTFVDRAGLDLVDLSEAQQTAAIAVLRALLSDTGYTMVSDIIGGDEFLHDNSTSTEDSLGQYYIAFFGAPSASTGWTLQFGGHHLGINATMDGAAAELTFAPTHFGSQPAVYTDADGNDVQPLAGMYEDAFAFYDSLTDDQLATVYQGSEVSNLVSAPGDVSDFPTGTGIAGSALSGDQRSLLLAVVANWIGLTDDETTAKALAAVETTLDDTYVSWSGATTYDMTTGEGIYYLISGPNVYVELSSQQGSAGADVDGYVTAGWGHIHTIYRDPTSDYLGSVTQQAASGMGAGGAPPA